jgi:hypothetical protein
MSAAPLCVAVPPVRGGVWDYAHALTAEMVDAAQVVSVAPGDHSTLDAAAGKHLFLQYSGYGYANRGAPVWLLRQIRRRRRLYRSFGVYFHELFAFGPPTSSAFWLSPLQRHVACGLVQMADYWLTSCDAYGFWLQRVGGKRPYKVLPVFSNVGESPVRLEHRLPRVVVFGSPRVRLATYREGGDALFDWARGSGLEIHDVGPPLGDEALSRRLAQERATVHGVLEADAVHELMADATYGVVAYGTQAPAKSSVFAAFCAHGLCTIVLADGGVEADGLAAGRHFLTGIPSAAVLDAARIGQAAWSWYQDHALAAHGAAVRTLVAATMRAAREAEACV